MRSPSLGTGTPLYESAMKLLRCSGKTRIINGLASIEYLASRLLLPSSYNQAMRLPLALTILILVPAFTFAQSNTLATSQDLSDAPSAKTDTASDPPVKPAVTTPSANSHPFWDRENVLLFSGVAAFRALDFASTKNFLARGRTEILVPDDVVNNNAGFAALEAAATGTSIG